MIRKAKKTDYNAMDSVFRAAAKQLCIASYDMEIIEAWQISVGRSLLKRSILGERRPLENIKCSAMCFSTRYVSNN